MSRRANLRDFPGGKGKLRPKVSGVCLGPQGAGQSQAVGSEDRKTDRQELDC